ncbi:hypothetical protein L226DRAFT_349165 [Lentinus tigrinus ALCF2SS1-7]|uniref:Uncharacterized protein n=1 Tax=Lentinus tigrinus ALCF2SS1-6 TaxID=1328759 RepID=A0A5C2RPD2_9APHY|nr:hypothetical protein L227DRAFT_423438 [Lentinus tigrinus ALCF2SS1-6]RPD68228.1 hypothetical protein L226DRAFT_349165 [Lentinus tigrinus ALCF2SS1-7]
MKYPHDINQAHVARIGLWRAVHDTTSALSCEISPSNDATRQIGSFVLALAAPARPTACANTVGAAHKVQLLANFLLPTNLAHQPPSLSIAPTTTTASPSPSVPMLCPRVFISRPLCAPGDPSCLFLSRFPAHAPACLSYIASNVFATYSSV